MFKTLKRFTVCLISIVNAIATLLSDRILRRVFAVSLCGVLAFSSGLCSAYLKSDSSASATLSLRSHTGTKPIANNELIVINAEECRDSTNDKNTSICNNSKMFERVGITENSSEGEKLKGLYQELLGAAAQLDKYRQELLNNNDFMGLFPEFYYNVTMEELKRIANGDFLYPIDKMQQMLAFYAAYEVNRENWDNQKKAEPHWEAHFHLAESTTKEYKIVCQSRFDNPDICDSSYPFFVRRVLNSGVDAHVNHDLARALRYSLENRSHQNIADLKKEFDCTESTLKAAGNNTLDEIFSLIPKLFANLTDKALGITQGVLEQRQKAWQVAVGNENLDKQPLLSKDQYEQLKQAGKKYQEDKCKQKSARSYNDPHLTTFDGLRYDLQALGEFILTKSKNGAFEVQTRQAPYASSLSVNSAVAMKVGSDRVALYARELPDADTSTPLRVNGKPVKIQGNKLALSGGEILQQGSNYAVLFPTGEKVLVNFVGTGNSAFLNVSPFVYNRSGKYSGLLGNVNDNPNDDLQIRGGTNVLKFRSTYGDVNKVFNLVGLRAPGALDKAEKVYFEQLYKEFGNSWRVKQEESLFDYPHGKTAQSYVDPNFPSQYLTLNMLSTKQIQKARNACTEAKVTQDLMEGCIFDVGFSGFSEFARATAEVNSYIDIINQLVPGIKIPKPVDEINRQIEKRKPKVCLFGVCPF